ncbi:hypothetical protein [Microbacterium arabinogalactanolyticum]|uniref:hypothetical protein n=1 Tax=Microbacterium arabinogalactanolyticum TaxID=69365 RepID=UPI0025572A3A|nr:hypothetical protein [Microbacterium arabinogalactanolyticum]
MTHNTMRSSTGSSRQQETGTVRSKLVEEANRGNREREAREQRALFAASYRIATR